MSNFPQILDPSEPASEDEPSVPDLYRDIVANGFGQQVPINFFTSIATRPDILEAVWGLVKALLVKGKLPLSLKQMIMMVISVQNECEYCQVTHSRTLETMGVSRATIALIAADPQLEGFPAPQRAVLQLARKISAAPESVAEEDYQVLRDHGLSDEEILEVVMTASLTGFVNTWAEAAGIDIDELVSS